MVGGSRGFVYRCIPWINAIGHPGLAWDILKSALKISVDHQARLDELLSEYRRIEPGAGLLERADSFYRFIDVIVSYAHE